MNPQGYFGDSCVRTPGELQMSIATELASAKPAENYAFLLSEGAANAFADPRCFIDGQWVEGAGETMQSFNPTTGEVLGEFRQASMEQVDQAIDAARAAFDRGPWSATSAAERSAILHRLADLMEQSKDVLAECITADVGVPVDWAQPPIDAVRRFAELALNGPDGWYEKALLPDPDSTSVLVREPIGVVVALSTWNSPYITAIWKLCGALAAGCTVILQCSPKGALCTLALWRLIAELDLPPGVVNMILGEVATGERLTTSPKVDMVSFTGSANIGARVMAQAAPTLKKVVLELGGKSPNIILPGIALEPTIKPSIDRIIANAGQQCGTTSRILVHEDQFDEFVALASAYLDDVVVGDPRDPKSSLGPVVDQGQLSSIQGYVDRALAAGGTIVAGGNDLPSGLPGGAFIAPLLIAGLSNDSEFCQEEQFGPVASILTYKTVEEAIEIANDTKYGLNAMVFGPTQDAIAVARRLRGGTAVVNGRGKNRDAPWGGTGRSGVGREGGNEGFREFFEVKHLNWQTR